MLQKSVFTDRSRCANGNLGVDRVSSALIALASLFLVTLVLAEAYATDSGRDAVPESWMQDARLNDVQFVNASTGWAVGDRGLILRTTDGGLTWLELSNVGRDANTNQNFADKIQNLRPLSQTQKTQPVTCRWHSVSFVDEKTGWLVGSYQGAYARRRRSIVMRTIDGGVKWHEIKGLVLPKINRIHLEHVKSGWAIGQNSNFYSSGLFFTHDGQTWESQGDAKSTGWIDGDKSGDQFIAIDGKGLLHVVDAGSRIEQAKVLDRQLGKLRAVRMLDTKTGWAVGDSGTVLQTRDGGNNWFTPAAVLESDDIGLFDFRTVTIAGDQVLFSGNPGTYVWSLSQDGKKLSKNRTPQSAPVNKLHFATSAQGWGVGDLGAIVATQNGGATWEIQRQSEPRLAYMAVVENSKNIPFEFLANYSSEKNMLSGVYVPDATPNEIDAIADATTQLGLSVRVTSAHPDSADSMRHLVRAIRVLQPEVIVCDSASEMKCQRAIADAANSTRFVDQLTRQGLTPFRVKRLLLPGSPSNETSDNRVTISSSAFLPKVSRLLEDQVALPRALLDLPIERGNKAYFDCRNYHGAPTVRGNDAFYGLGRRGTGLPKRVADGRVGSLGAVQRASQKQRQFKLMLLQNAKTPAERATWRRQIQMLGTGSDNSEVGIWLWQLADEYFKQGDFDLAAYTLEHMIGRVGDHALSGAALTWLTQFYASQEHLASHIAANHQDVEPASAEDKALDEIDEMMAATRPEIQAAYTEVKEIEIDGTKHMIWQPVENNGQGVVPAVHVEGAFETLRKERLRSAARYAKLISYKDPDVAKSAEIRFIEATILRQVEGDVSAENLLRLITKDADADSAEKINATRELRISDAVSRQKKNLEQLNTIRLLSAAKAIVRPHLDGQLDDDVWQDSMSNGKVIFQRMIEGAGAKPKTDIVVFSYDDEFLYVAGRCQKIVGQSYLLTEAPRPRDPKLSDRDRVEIAIDIDRDYRSAFEFTIDYRGWVRDGCSGSSGWDPRWYVAAHHEQKAWSFECAIPLSELNLSKIADVNDGQIVAVSLQRKDYQSKQLWNVDANDSGKKKEVVASGLMHSLRLSNRKYSLLGLGTADTAKTEKSKVKPKQ